MGLLRHAQISKKDKRTRITLLIRLKKEIRQKGKSERMAYHCFTTSDPPPSENISTFKATIS